jgi:hypothetical protein
MLTKAAATEYLARIRKALKTAYDAVKQFAPGTFAVLGLEVYSASTQVGWPMRSRRYRSICY